VETECHWIGESSLGSLPHAGLSVECRPSSLMNTIDRQKIHDVPVMVLAADVIGRACARPESGRVRHHTKAACLQRATARDQQGAQHIMNTQKQIATTTFLPRGLANHLSLLSCLCTGPVEDSCSGSWSDPAAPARRYLFKVFSNPLRGVRTNAAYLRSLLGHDRGAADPGFPRLRRGRPSPRPGTTPRSRALSTRAPQCPG